MGREQELICANCGIAIHWQSTLVDDKAYCCHGCAEGGPCACDYDNLPPRGAVRPMIHHSVYESSARLPDPGRHSDSGKGETRGV